MDFKNVEVILTRELVALATSARVVWQAEYTIGGELLIMATKLVQEGPEWSTHCQTAFSLTTTPPIPTIPGTSHLFG